MPQRAELTDLGAGQCISITRVAQEAASHKQASKSVRDSAGNARNRTCTMVMTESGRINLPLACRLLAWSMASRTLWYERGHFLTFVTERAAQMTSRLAELDVVVDVRGDRLRFGFSIYHDPEDIAELLTRLVRL